MLDHALQQIQASRDIVAKIQKRLLHRLTYQRLGGEVHHGIGPMLAESGINRRSIGKIAFNKNCVRMHRRTMALGEIVEYHYRLICSDQLLDYHTPDIAGSAGDQDFHEFLSLK